MKSIFITLFLSLAFSCHTLAEDKASASLLLRKSGQWLRDNHDFSLRLKQKKEDKSYSKAQLYFKIIDVLKQKNAFGTRAFKAISALINKEPELAMIYNQKLIDLIAGLEMTDKQKDQLQVDLAYPYSNSKGITQNIQSRKEEKPSLKKTLKMAKGLIQSMPLPRQITPPLIGSLETLEEVLLTKTDGCYDTDPDCQFKANIGIINYMSKRVQESHELAFANLRFGISVQHLNRKHHELLQIAPLHNESYDFNIWPTLVKDSLGDELLALEVISTFGHDVGWNDLTYRTNKPKFLTMILNIFKPSGYGVSKNEDPKSFPYLPGVLNGQKVSNKTINNLTKTLVAYNKSHNKQVVLRNGYYHVYGGVLITQALLAKKHSRVMLTNTATLISQALGYMYKRLQLPRYLNNDSKWLWKRMNQSEYKKIIAPLKWEEARFQKAKSRLQLHLALMKYTEEEQHYIGAQFARRIYQK